MRLVCLSASHHTTPLALRECLSLSPERIAEALTRHPVRHDSADALAGLVVLSTCNRLELYALVAVPDGMEDAEAAAPLLSILKDEFELPQETMQPYIQLRSGLQAAEHLFRVAAGLDSIAVGETQILGQVARAFEAAQHLGSAGHFLSSLFRSAIHAAKRAHSETGLGRHPTSLSALAVELGEARLGPLADRSTLVVGAGKMGTLALEALRERHARQIQLANRSLEHARERVHPPLERALALDCLPEALEQADLVLVAASAPAPLLSRPMLAAALAQRPQRLLTVIDLSVPRSVDPACSYLPGLHLFDLDGLQEYVRTSAGSRNEELQAAQQILSEELAAFDQLLQVMPLIGELHKKVEQIRQREVQRSLRRLGADPDPRVAGQIELLSRSLVNKILHEPTMHLRSETDKATLGEYVQTLSALFDLTGD
jgi:glutamyl-tRNA reductase